MTRDAATHEELAALEQAIDDWFRRQKEELPILLDISRDEEIPRRWYARLEGEERDVTTIWLTLGQRTLKYETYFLPSPEVNREQLFELLLEGTMTSWELSSGLALKRRYSSLANFLFMLSTKMNSIEFWSIWDFVERYWRAALKIGFANRFTETPKDIEEK